MKLNQWLEISVIDTHTGGEPTRIVYSGGPDLGTGPVSRKRDVFQRQFDHVRSAVVREPRGSDVLVGALLVPSGDPSCVCGTIFFNNIGYLGMCGHGTIGVAVALGRLGRISAGTHRIETPVGIVPFEFDGEHTVTLQNVPSYRHRASVALEIPDYGLVVGDVAWGGNWFFLVRGYSYPVTLQRVDELTRFCWAVRHAMERQSITGADGAEIDHVEVFTEPHDPSNSSRNFVLCPGGAYDRSPCGTGTSAKLACLAADQKLQPGQIWRQESVLGSVFEAWYGEHDSQIVPSIRGTAYVCADAKLLIDPHDPFRWGITD